MTGLDTGPRTSALGSSTGFVDRQRTPLAVNTAPFQPLADEHVVHNETEEARLVLIVDL